MNTGAKILNKIQIELKKTLKTLLNVNKWASTQTRSITIYKSYNVMQHIHKFKKGQSQKMMTI